MHELTQGPPAPRTAPAARGGRRLPRTALFGAALVAALAIGLSACGGGSPQSSGVASVTTTTAARGGTTTTTTHGTTSTTTAKPNPEAFAQCMRSHGITNFPDPKPTGQTVFNVGTTGLNPQSPQFQAAMSACKHYLGPGGGTAGNGGVSKKVLLDYAKCMRAHGVTNFPDPVQMGGQKGGGQWGFNLAAAQVNQTSPSFQAANQKCKSKAFGGIHPCSGGGSLRDRYHARRC